MKLLIVLTLALGYTTAVHAQTDLVKEVEKAWEPYLSWQRAASWRIATRPPTRIGYYHWRQQQLYGFYNWRHRSLYGSQRVPATKGYGGRQGRSKYRTR